MCLQKSALEHDVIYIDADTNDMLKAINFEDIAGVSLNAAR